MPATLRYTGSIRQDGTAPAHPFYRVAADSALAYAFGMRFRVTEIRKAQGIVQSELAARAGIRVATLSEIESGKGNPRLDTLAAIAGALGCSVVDLFDDGGDDPSASEIIAALGLLSPEQRAGVVALISPKRS